MPKKYWKPEHQTYLEQNYKQLSPKQITCILGFHQSQINRKIKEYKDSQPFRNPNIIRIPGTYSNITGYRIFSEQ